MLGGCSGIAVKCTLQSGGGFQVSFSGVMDLVDLQIVSLSQKYHEVSAGQTR